MPHSAKNAPFLNIDGFYRQGQYGFFGRKGGVSKKGCASLNASFAASDTQENVLANRMTALQSLSPHADKLAVLKQIHSAKVVTVTSNTALPFPHHLEGDGLVTDCPAIALGVLTADCAPALFYGRKASGAPVIGAAHAGWGGALTGILGNTIQAMLALGAEKQTIHAAIGPCIAQDSYEVDMDFKAPFLAQNAETERFFKFATNNDEKAYFDLKGYNIWRMIEAGLEPQNIFVSSIDTYTDKDSYFSHRRATHEGAPQAEGRQISLIYI